MDVSLKPVKINAGQYASLAVCSKATGIPIARLIREALDTYIKVTVPVKMEFLSRTPPPPTIQS